MPQVKGGPTSLNKRLEEVYAGCIKGGGTESTCSAVAWSQAKKDGWRKVGSEWRKNKRV